MPCALDFENELRISKRTTNVEKTRFRSEFQRSMRKAMQLGEGLERAFGIAWEYASEEVLVSDEGQSELFAELIQWAKNRRK
jgi:uncharacterized protein YggL (DUF469 family)